MCGIVGYIGEKQAAPILLEGLSKLEYRGYDSAGIAILNDNKIIDRLIEYGSDLALMKIKGKMMTIEETAKFRAENLYKQLKNNRIK